MKKISRYDKLMAIKRHPEFIKEYMSYKRLKNLQGQPALKKQVEFVKKWGEELRAIELAEKMKDTANPVKVATRIDYNRAATICRTGD